MTNETPRVRHDINNSEASITRPCILLTGLRRSGKTSIQRVIFTKMQPSQTQFLKSTPQMTVNHFSCGSFINFQVQELPGQLHSFPLLEFPNNGDEENSQLSLQEDDLTYKVGGGYDIERLLRQCHAVVYVIDAQDDYSQSVCSLNQIIKTGKLVNPKVRYEVFIHKVDQLLEDAKMEVQRDIHNQVQDYFADSIDKVDSWPIRCNVLNANSQEILINFHLTSIYDHSVFEAFSKVVQKLMPQVNHLERLLNYLLSSSNIEKAFLFDIQTKISIANDSSPTDMQIYELCCDMIDLLIGVSQIYGQSGDDDVEEIDNDAIMNDEQLEEKFEFLDNGNSEFVTNGVHSSMTFRSSLSWALVKDPISSSIETTNEPASNVFDSMSSAIIKLTGGRALYLKEINRHLALTCILREEALTKQAIIEYNVNQLKKTISKLF